jgi:hypothetical protein
MRGSRRISGVPKSGAFTSWHMGLPLEKKSVGPHSRYGSLSLASCQRIPKGYVWSRPGLLLLQLKRPVRICHCLQRLRVLLQKLVIYPPEASNVLLASTIGATVIADMQGENVTGKPVTVEVHCCCDFGASKANVLCPSGHCFLGGVANMAYGIVSIQYLTSAA